MKKNGFTLIEILSVIVIMGVLLVIVIPVTTNIIAKTKTDAYNRTVDNIKRAAKSYFSEDKNNLAQIDIYSGSNMVTLQELVDYGLLKSEIKDPRDNSLIPLTTYVVVTLTVDGEYVYEYKDKTDSGISSIETKVGSSVSIVGGNIIGVAAGMTEAQLLSQFNKGYYLKVYNGNTLLEYNDVVNSGDKVRLYNQSTGILIMEYNIL